MGQWPKRAGARIRLDFQPRERVGGDGGVVAAQFAPGDGAVVVAVEADGEVEIAERDLPFAIDAAVGDAQAEIAVARFVRLRGRRSEQHGREYGEGADERRHGVTAPRR